MKDIDQLVPKLTSIEDDRVVEQPAHVGQEGLRTAVMPLLDVSL